MTINAKTTKIITSFHVEFTSMFFKKPGNKNITLKISKLHFEYQWKYFELNDIEGRHIKICGMRLTA